MFSHATSEGSFRHYSCGHKAKGITASIAWRRREAWKEEALDNLLERTREGHRQSDEHYRFKGNVGETSERRGGACMDLSVRIAYSDGVS